MSAAVPDTRIDSYRNIQIYGTKSRVYVVGHDAGVCRILKFRRQDGPQLDVVVDPICYTPSQLSLVLRKVHEQSGGLQLICKGHGIIGCFRFTHSYYLLVVARREYVGHICGHKVYRIAETCLISLSASQQRLDNTASDSTAEKRYRKLLLGVDLTKSFFLSYSYNLAHTLQQNHTQAAAAAADVQGTGTGTGQSLDGAAAAATDAAATPEPEASHAAEGTAKEGEGPVAQAADAAGDAAAAAAAATAAAAAAAAAGWDVYDSSMFVWNAYLTRPLRAAIQSSRWTVPLIHGYWEQRQVNVFGRHLTLTLLARRSRHFAGTRYRKRGISAQGFVANEVETEQIVDAGIDWSTGQPLWSSMVQLRGSVPLFWSQQATTLSPKPDIVLQQFDPAFEITAAHFADLRRRYGDPIIVLNLLKSKERRPRELLLRSEFAAALAVVNAGLAPQQQVIYIPWDFNQHAKRQGANLLVDISAVMSLALDATGIYVHGPASCSSCAPAIQQRLKAKASRAAAPTGAAADAPYGSQQQQQGCQQQQQQQQEEEEEKQEQQQRQQQGQQQQQPVVLQPASSQPVKQPGGAPKPRISAPQTRLQHGILRSNCIDCLDRTNVAQFAYGLAAFGRQLAALGVLDEGCIDSDSSVAFQLMEMYEAMGHTLALQYGGSEAHAGFFQKKRGEWDATTQSRDLMTSIRRFYSNAYTDAEKQDAINLFLGNYVPLPGAPPLWELDSDYYLHSEAAIRYSQWVCVARTPNPAALAANAPEPTAAAHLPGGRQAPGLLRQLSATTLPPSALGFICNSSVSSSTSYAGSGGSSGGPVAAWTPFSAAAAAAAAAPAEAAPAHARPAASRGGSSSSSVRDDPTPLLPLTYSDEISIDVTETDAAAAVTEGAFNFKLVFQQMLPATIEAPSISFEQHSRVVSMDHVLARLPRSRNVRLYPVTARNNVMWEAVQQAFAFFSTSEGSAAAAAAAGAAGAGGSSSSNAAAGGNGGPGGMSGSESLPSIQALNLTASSSKRQLLQQQHPLATMDSSSSFGDQQQQQVARDASVSGSVSSTQAGSAAAVADGAAAGAAAAAGGGSGSGNVSRRPSRASVGDSPSASTAVAAAAAASSQLLRSISNLGTGLKSQGTGQGMGPSAPAVSGLNDILEIRTDLDSVRCISSPDQPPQAYCPQGPVLPRRAKLDATLDDMMWSQFGVSIATPAHRSTAGPGSPTMLLRPSSAQANSSITTFATGPPTEPGTPAAGFKDRVFGVWRGGSGQGSPAGAATARAAAGAGAAGGKGVLSPLNDILGIQKAPAGSVGGGAVAGRQSGVVMLAGGSSKVSPSGYYAPVAGISSRPGSTCPYGSAAAAGVAAAAAAGGSGGSPVMLQPAPSTSVGGSSHRPSGHRHHSSSGSSGDSSDSDSSESDAADNSSRWRRRQQRRKRQQLTVGRVTFAPAAGAAAAAAATAATAAADTAAVLATCPLLPATPAAAAAAPQPAGCAVQAAVAAACAAEITSSPKAAAAAATAGGVAGAFASAVPEWAAVPGQEQHLHVHAAAKPSSSPHTALADAGRKHASAAVSASADAVAYCYWGPHSIPAQQQAQNSPGQAAGAAAAAETAAAASGGTAWGGADAAGSAGSVAHMQQQQLQQQQRQVRVRSMFAPVDVETAAAAMGLQAPALNTLDEGAGVWGLAAEASLTGQQSAQQADSSSGRRSRQGWVSSAEVAGPSLRSWSEGAAGGAGLLPEVKAVWWGLGDVHGVWSCAEAGSRAAYQQYRRDIDRLADSSSCKVLQGWYQRQQFTIPVVIGS